MVSKLGTFHLENAVLDHLKIVGHTTPISLIKKLHIPKHELDLVLEKLIDRNCIVFVPNGEVWLR